MLKGGLSQVVSVVILIALTISLVGGVFMVTRDYVTKGLGKAGVCKDIYEKVSLNPDYTCYDPVSRSVLFSISRNEFALEYLLVSVSYEDSANNFHLTDNSQNISNLKSYGSSSTIEIISESTIVVEDSDSEGANDPLTLTIPITVSGEDRFLLACIPFENKHNSYVESVVFNEEEPFYRIDFIENSDKSRIEFWGLINPSLSDAEVLITFSETLERGATSGLYALSGVDQNSPSRTPSKGSPGEPSSFEITITGEEGDLFIDCAGVEKGKSLTMVAMPERVKLFSFEEDHYVGASSSMPGSESETMTWIMEETDKAKESIMGIAIKPASTTTIIPGPELGTEVVLPRNESGKSYCLYGETRPTKIEIAPKVGGKQCGVVDSILEIPTCRSELRC